MKRLLAIPLLLAACTPTAQLPPPDPATVARITAECQASGVFVAINTAGGVALRIATGLPGDVLARVVNTGLEEACTHPEIAAQHEAAVIADARQIGAYLKAKMQSLHRPTP